MIHTLIGDASVSRAAWTSISQRHDGQAVTCEDFVAAMEDASGLDLAQFTPLVRPGRHAAAQGRGRMGRSGAALHAEPHAKPYPHRLRAAPQGRGQPIGEGPLHLPVALGLVLPDGTDAPLRLVGEHAAQGTTRVLSLTAATQTFVFEDVPVAPVASLLRDFSAPVQLDFEQTDAELAHLMAHDADAFNRWEAGQRLATRVLLAGVKAWRRGRRLDPGGLRRRLRPRARRRPHRTTPRWPPKRWSCRPNRCWPSRGRPRPAIDPEAIHNARVTLRRHLATQLRDRFEAVWRALAPAEPYAPDGAQVGRRALRNLCLGYLAESDDAYLRDAVLPRLLAQFERAAT